MYNPGAFKTSLNYYRQDLTSWEHLKISKSYFEFPWGEISKCTSFWCWEKKSRLYTSKHTSSCWRSLPGKSLHPSSGSLSLFFPPSLYPSPLSPSKESWLWTCKPSRAGRGNPKGRQFWVVWREGPTSKWLDGAGCGGYHFLCASLAKFCSQQHSFPVESRSSPPSPQSFSETHFSIPSASWELTLTGRVGHLLNPSTK